MKIERIEASRVKLTFDVTKEEFEIALDKAFEKEKETIEVKGFRKGHCPRNVFEAKFGVESLFQTALDIIGEEKWNDALDCKDFEVVGQPQLEIDGKLERGNDFKLVFIAPVKPEVKLGQYKDIIVSKPKTEVTDEDVKNGINKLIEKDAVVEAKEDKTIAKGDIAVFDFEGFTDGVAFDGGKAENYELEIGSNQFIPGFEDQMVGLKAGEQKDINVKFPENYNEKLAGKDATFKLNIKDVKTKVYPELTDEYVKSLNKENVNNAEELKASVKQEIGQQLHDQARNQILDDAMKIIATNCVIDIPDAMIEQEADRRKQEMIKEAEQYKLDLKTLLGFYGMTEEQYNAQVGLQAAQYVRYNLIIEKIIEVEKFVATEEEFNKKVAELAKHYNVSEDQIKQFIPADSINFEINYNKALELIVSSAKFEA